MRLGPVLLFVCALAGMAAQSAAQTPAGNAASGKTAWTDTVRCAACHGAQGEGGFGPDLAGRALTFDQFRRAVRQPWGVMLAFTEQQLSDQMLADVHAFMTSLPKPAKVGAPAFKTPAGAPLGQVSIVDGIGCAQCHQPELRIPRRYLGGKAADATYDMFAKLVYEHTHEFPDGHMGNYSRTRLPESVLREIYRFAKDDLGWLVPITATIAPGVSTGADTTYTLTVKNTGEKGKGLAAEDLTVALLLPTASRVVSTTGSEYQGVRPNTQGARDVSAEAAIWTTRRIAPGEELSYSVTLPGPPVAPGTLFRDSMVSWAKPAMRVGAPTLELRDPRMTRKDDFQAVTFPPAASR